MEQSSMRVREAFGEAAGFLVSAVDSVPPDRWAGPGVGEWTIAELAVHASRAASTLVTYVDGETDLSIESAADYYAAALKMPDISSRVAARAREQAAAIDVSIPDYVKAAVAEAELVLCRTPANAIVATPVGGMRLIDYLPTRIVEMVVHGIDLSDAVDVEPGVPATALGVTLETLADLAVVRPEGIDPASIVRALTGRGRLPESANLLG